MDNRLHLISVVIKAVSYLLSFSSAKMKQCFLPGFILLMICRAFKAGGHKRRCGFIFLQIFCSFGIPLVKQPNWCICFLSGLHSFTSHTHKLWFCALNQENCLSWGTAGVRLCFLPFKADDGAV